MVDDNANAAKSVASLRDERIIPQRYKRKDERKRGCELDNLSQLGPVLHKTSKRCGREIVRKGNAIESSVARLICKQCIKSFF
jgi:hypothetical protein